MRFLALLKKELRECLPWTVLATAFLLIFGSLVLWDKVRADLDLFSKLNAKAYMVLLD